MKRGAPPETLVQSLGRHFFLGRSTAYVPERHAVLHGARHLEAAAALSGRKTAEARALRGRLLRLAGRLDEAAAELAAALELEERADALSWRWELEAALGRGRAGDASRAAALEPGNGWRRLWHGLALADGGELVQARDQTQAARALLPKEAFPAAVDGLILWRMGRKEAAVHALDRALALDPSLQWAWRLRGICKGELGDLSGCLSDSLAALRLDENAGLLFCMLGLASRKNDTRLSLETATRHIEKNPDDFWAYLFRADNRRSPEIGDNQGALQDLRRASELEPGRGIVWAYLSRAQLTTGDFKGAAQSIERAVALDPDCGWVRAWHGEFLRRSGDPRGARRSLDLALKLFPDYELAYAWRGSALRLLGKPAEALKDLDAAISLKPHTLDLCWFERMQTLRALGRTGEALEACQHASALNPKYAWETEPARFAQGLAELDAEIARAPRAPLAHLWRGELMMRRRDFSRAEKDLTRALAAKDCPLEALILRGRARCELADWRGAFEDLDEAIRRRPGAAFAYAWRGRARMLSGKAAAAIADFDKALASEKNSAWLLSWKGEAELRLGRLEAAEASLTQALQVHAKFAQARVWLAAVKLRAGRARDALADLDAALALQPGATQALFWRARALEALGRFPEALADARRAAQEPGPLSGDDQDEARALVSRLEARRPGGAQAARLETAKAWQREGRHEEAAAAYTEMLEKAPGDADILRRRAEAYRCMARYDLALRDLDQVAAQSLGSAEALSARVELKRHLYDFEGGLADADAALALDGRSAGAWALRAECLRSLGRYGEAQEAASKAIALDAEWPWARVVRAKARRQAGDLRGALSDARAAAKAAASPDPYAHAWAAEILRKLGRRQEALREAARACALAPGNAWALALRGQVRVELGAADAGLADVLQAVRLDPRCSCDYDFLGSEGPHIRTDRALDWVYALRGGARRAAGRLAEARADLDHAAALSPRCAWISAWRGELVVQQGEAAAGVAALRRALKLHGRYAQAWVWLGQALLKQDQPAGARKAFESALAQEPDNVWALIGRAVCLEKAGRAAEAGQLLQRAKSLAPALFESAGT